MPATPRPSLLLPSTLVLAALPLGGCFDPGIDIAPGDSTGSGSEEPSASESSESSDGAEGPLDSTGPGDAPPEILAFTVNGSTMPTEQQAAGMIVLDVDATDDLGIERIDLYDGDEVVAILTEAPYRTELLISSADNGTHLYSARAVDTSDQAADSEVIPLSVNVVGGTMLELREDIGDVYSPLLVGFPRVTTDSEDNIIATFTAPAGPMHQTQVQAIEYSSTLSLLWESTLSAPGETALSMSRPIVTLDGELLSGGAHGLLQNTTMALFRANEATGLATAPLSLGPTGDDTVAPIVAQLPSGEVLVSSEPHVLQARTPDLATVVWSHEQFPEAPENQLGVHGIVGIDVNPIGESLITFVPPDAQCGAERAPCIRKLGPGGMTLWTRPAAGNNPSLVTPSARFDSLDRAITVWAYGSEGLFCQIYATDGSPVTNFMVLDGNPMLTIDFAIDLQDNLLVVGLMNEEVARPWAARITQDGSVVWSTVYDDLSLGDYGALISGATISRDGRAYLAGGVEVSQPELLVLEGKAWLAEIQL